MKEKLTQNNHDLDNFKMGLNSDIDKSLSIMGKSRQLSTQTGERNFLGEFRNVINQQNESAEIKNSYQR